MSFVSDLKVLYHLLLRPVRGDSHAQRMENFYSGQADAYDDFRKRLLQGREELYAKIAENRSGTWVDLGGGTGANLEFIGPAISQFQRVYVVDLASSLLKVADKRAAERGWSQVRAVTADATQWQPEEGLVDIVTFSYSLTMIPDWFAAIDNAIRMLKPVVLSGLSISMFRASIQQTNSNDTHGRREASGPFGLPGTTSSLIPTTFPTCSEN